MAVEITEEEFKHLMALLMCSDPYPVDGSVNNEGLESMNRLCNKIADSFGFNDWIEAYHKM